MAVALAPAPAAPNYLDLVRASIPSIPLRQMCETDRFLYMDRLEQYFRGRQDDAKRYDWSGAMRVPLSQLPMAPGFYIALDRRRPSTRKNLARMITSRLTQMAVDGEAFCEINVDQDDVSQAALREWSKIMQLPQKVAEARDSGGAEGTGCLSLGVVNARFCVDVHNAKHVTVLAWADRQKFVPWRVLKAYMFRKPVYENGKREMRDFWYVRFWDASTDIVWEAIPSEIANMPDWMMRVAPSFEGYHGFGFCPFYWTQNLPNSEEEDGEGDYEGLEDKFDEYNRLLSATTKGTTENVDPTLVIKDEDDGEQRIEKGSGAVIHSKDGADFLELSGGSAKTALELLNELRVDILEETQVVNPREDKITGAAQSAAAMRILYAPMISRCNKLRAQYGDTIQRLLQDILAVARKLRDTIEEIRDQRGVVVEKLRRAVIPDLDPGQAEIVTLKWPTYFHPTSQDIKDTTSTAQAACGGKPVISHKTAVEFAASYFGVEDTDQELAEIEADQDTEMERTKEALQTEASINAKAGAGAEE